MHRWYIKILLKNNQIIKGYIEDEINNSDGVAKKFFTGDYDCFNGISGENEKINLFFKLAEVVAFWISFEPFDSSK